MTATQKQPIKIKTLYSEIHKEKFDIYDNGGIIFPDSKISYTVEEMEILQKLSADSKKKVHLLKKKFSEGPGQQARLVNELAIQTHKNKIETIEEEL